jgi:predicted O-methyltransferase YrrM
VLQQLALLTGASTTLRAEAADDTDFYQRWPSVEPADVLPYVRATARAGDADAVVAALDEWGRHYPNYSCGPEKGALLEDLAARTAPRAGLEVGTFLGYSALRTARHLAARGRLRCIEASQANAEVAKAVLEYAGVGNVVDVTVGLSSDVLVDAAGWFPAGADWVFLDHCKPCLLPDTLRMEELGIIRAGTVVIADNVVYPGAPDYLRHVGDARAYDTRLIDCSFEYNTPWRDGFSSRKRDAISVSVRK